MSSHHVLGATLRRVTTSTVTSRRMVIAGALSGALVLGSAGVAVAYWQAPGTGTGSAGTGTVSLSANAISTSGLYPGSSAPVSLTVSSTTTSAVSLTSLQSGIVSVSPGTGTCTAVAVSFTVTTALPVTMSGGSAVLAGTVSMASTAEDGCQGRTFTIPLTVNGHV